MTKTKYIFKLCVINHQFLFILTNLFHKKIISVHTKYNLSTLKGNEQKNEAEKQHKKEPFKDRNENHLHYA